MPCAMTVHNAPTASHRIQRRRSTNSVQIAIASVSDTSVPRHHAVAPFIAYAADKLRNLHQVAERGGPVGDRQASVVAGYQRTGDDHDETSHTP